MEKGKNVSIKDIAAKLHVSLSTVHKALTGKPGISDTRRQEILAVAAEMGYVVNPIAQTMSRKSIRIGVIYPAVWNEFFAQMQAGIDAELLSLQKYKVSGIYYTMSADPSPAEADKIRSWLTAEQIDAVLYCASHYTFNQIAETALRDCSRPVFWVGGGISNPLNAPSITIDASLAGKMAADFLCCTTQKPVKSAVFLGSTKNSIHRAKAEAFCSRINENDGEVLQICETEDAPEKAYSAICQLHAAHPDLNAIYVCTATSDPICAYLAEKHLESQITLLGTDIFDTLRKYVTAGVMKGTIFQNQQEVGRLAAACAYEYLNKHSTYGYADWTPEKLMLVKPELLLKANLE